jgi:hypothetical protein
VADDEIHQEILSRQFKYLMEQEIKIFFGAEAFSTANLLDQKF